MSTTIQSGQAITTGGTKVDSGFRASGESDAASAAPTIGVASSSYGGGVSGPFDVDYVESGILEDSGWSFTAMAPVYAGADGRPTQSGDPGPSYRLLGVALSATRILLLLPQPAYPRAAAAERPLSIGDVSRAPHQATDAERPLHKDFYGLGGPSAVQPAAHREVTAQYVDNTHLALKMMGDDGVVRSIVLALG